MNSNSDVSKFNKVMQKNVSKRNIMIYVICFILLIVVGYGLYLYITKRNKKKSVKIMDFHEITKDFEKKVNMDKIKLPEVEKGDVLGVTFGFKIFIDNMMENENWGKRIDQLKTIINYSPGVFYHPIENYLEFVVDIKDNIQFNAKQAIKYDRPPLQKWLSIIVVFTSTKMTVYSNGEMVVNKKLKNPPIFKSDDIYIGEKNNNMKGKLGPIIFWPYPLDSSEISSATRRL